MDGLQLLVKRWVDLANRWLTNTRCSGIYHNTPVHKSEQEAVAYFSEKGLEEKVSSVSGVWELVHFSSGFWMGGRIHLAVWMGLVQGSMMLPVSSLVYWLAYLKVILIIFTINLQSSGALSVFLCLSLQYLPAPILQTSCLILLMDLALFQAQKPFRSTRQAEKAYSLVILLVRMMFEDSHIKNEKPIFIYTSNTQKMQRRNKNRKIKQEGGWKRRMKKGI